MCSSSFLHLIWQFQNDTSKLQCLRSLSAFKLSCCIGLNISCAILCRFRHHYRFPVSFSVTSTSPWRIPVLLARLDCAVEYKCLYSHTWCLYLSLQMFYSAPWMLCFASQGWNVVTSLCPNWLPLFQSLVLFLIHPCNKQMTFYWIRLNSAFTLTPGCNICTTVSYPTPVT
jgi:hypothetical protein